MPPLGMTGFFTSAFDFAGFAADIGVGLGDVRATGDDDSAGLPVTWSTGFTAGFAGLIFAAMESFASFASLLRDFRNSQSLDGAGAGFGAGFGAATGDAEFTLAARTDVSVCVLPITHPNEKKIVHSTTMPKNIPTT
jgi:hypothetical protein